MNACTSVGIVCPMVSVPGIFSSGMARRARYSAVVVAYEPMPSVSKKLVTVPVRVRNQFGTRHLRRRAISAAQTAQNAAAMRPSSTNRAVFADGTVAPRDSRPRLEPQRRGEDAVGHSADFLVGLEDLLLQPGVPLVLGAGSSRTIRAR